MLERSTSNPIIKPEMVKPSANGYQVVGSFNPGATIYNDEIILLIRTAEKCEEEKGFINIPYFDFTNGSSTPKILRIAEDDSNLIKKDTRGYLYKEVDYLSSVSHLRIARSKDGINFEVDDKPFISPSLESEAYGVEDARISKIGDTYYINYTAVSKDGYVTSLVTTKDFISIERKGIIFPPLNKDITIFEEKVNGKYIALHRPDNQGFGLPSIWYADSPDLINWGNHSCLLRPDGSIYENQKIGGGAPPIKTNQGWLVIYHGKGENSSYCLRLLLLDLDDPSKIIKQSKKPILLPEEDYEKQGFFGNVVFSNGTIVKDNGEVYIYYGACDDTVCLAYSSISDLLNMF